MFAELKSNFELSDKMNQLIRETVKTAIEEGYSISTIKNAISNEFKANIPEENLSELEIKLMELFKERDPRETRLRRKHFAMICSAYYKARESGLSFEAVKLWEVAATVAKRLSLKENSIKCEIVTLSYFLKCNFLQLDGYSKEILEAFYKKYMKNL